MDDHFLIYYSKIPDCEQKENFMRGFLFLNPAIDKFPLEVHACETCCFTNVVYWVLYVF